MTLTVQPITHPVILIDGEHIEHNPHRRFFDFDAAYQAVINHCLTLPSSQTPEQHTLRNYTAGLDYFLAFLEDRIPTKQIMQSYIAHLINDRGLKSTTIAAKYLAPARHFCNALADQELYKNATGSPSEMFELSITLPEWRKRIEQAAKIKNPRPETTSNLAPLWQHGKRLTLNQVNSILWEIDRSNIAGLRDYALLMVGFTTGLRLAELSRMSLSSITKEDDTWLVRVRRKRSNNDPVPTSDNTIQAVFAYVEAFNAGLSDDDPRRINADTPLWQPMMHGENNYVRVGHNRYDPQKGMCNQALRKVIARRSEEVLGEPISPHDLRRTVAALAYLNNMQLPQIQMLLGHKNGATTLGYIGKPPNWKDATLATYIQIG